MKPFHRRFQLPKLVHPLSFVLGLIVGLFLCATAGKWASRQNLLKGYVRNVGDHTIGQLFYPTASEYLSIVHALADRNKVIVIIGGTSVMVGLGQSNAELWSQYLEKLLGPDYRVFNFAFFACHTYEGAAPLAEALNKEGYKVIFVSDGMQASSGTFDGPFYLYRYLYWDAYYKNLLYPYKPREKRMFSRRNLDREEVVQKQELGIRYFLDSKLYFEDFWNTVACDYVFTVWSDMTPHFFWKARGPMDGDMILTKGANPPTEKRKEEFAEECRGRSRFLFSETKDKKWALVEGQSKSIKEDYRIAMPDFLKARTLIVCSYYSNDIRRRLTPAERERDTMMVEYNVTTRQQEGYKALEFGRDYNDDDYFDHIHLSPEGGQKLAQAVAHEVTQIASDYYGLKGIPRKKEPSSLEPATVP